MIQITEHLTYLKPSYIISKNWFIEMTDQQQHLKSAIQQQGELLNEIQTLQNHQKLGTKINEQHMCYQYSQKWTEKQKQSIQPF